MMNTRTIVESLSSADIRSATQELVRRSHGLDAQLLVHLGEILEALRSGQVHLAGLRLLAPHLTTENQEKVLAEAAGKSKRQIEELVARLSPQPAVASIVRKLPGRPNPLPETSPALSFGSAAGPGTPSG